MKKLLCSIHWTDNKGRRSTLWGETDELKVVVPRSVLDELSESETITVKIYDEEETARIKQFTGDLEVDR